MCLHSVLNLSPVERVKKCIFSNTNKNQNCTQIALGKNTILLGFRYSTLTFMSKRAPRVISGSMYLGRVPGDPGIYILPNRFKGHEIPIHRVEFLAPRPPPPKPHH